MKYMVDSADVRAIKKINEYYPISGVTTNPSLVFEAGRDLKTLIREIREIIGSEKMLHVQTLSLKAKDIVAEAGRIVDFAGPNTYVKIPVTPEGMKAIMAVKAQGIGVTATAIFTPQQALMAATAGADFVAPYINRLDNIAVNGVEIAGQIADLLRTAGSPCEVLAASFNNIEQIHMTSLHGVGVVTISPKMFEKIIYHPLTDIAVEDFVAKGKDLYNI